MSECWEYVENADITSLNEGDVIRIQLGKHWYEKTLTKYAIENNILFINGMDKGKVVQVYKKLGSSSRSG
jgi:hypothetical protein